MKIYIKQCLEAVLYIHSCDLIHRDIKPDNLLIGKDGKVKVVDFGLAFDATGKSKLSHDIAGTLRYLAPEVISGVGQSKKSDIWSIGVVLEELAFGYELSTNELMRIDESSIDRLFLKTRFSKNMRLFLKSCLSPLGKRPDAITLLNHPWLSKKGLILATENQELEKQYFDDEFKSKKNLLFLVNTSIFQRYIPNICN